ALFLRRQLVFEVNACRASFNHGLHQLKDVEWTTEACICIGNNGGKPVGIPLAFRPLDLVSTLQCLVDSLDHVRNAVGGIETLVRAHLCCRIRICCHLPATEVDGHQTSLDLLDGLVSSQGTQGCYVLIRLQKIPQTPGTQTCQCMLDLKRPA